MSHLADAFDIGNLQCRVSRCFEVNNAGVRFDSFFNSVHIGDIDEGYFYTIAGHAVVQESECAAIERIAGYYMITCMEQCPESGRNSAHTRSCRAAGFAAFEHGNFFFNLRIGRIAKTGINVARFF